MGIPYSYRFLLLLSILAILVFVDLLRHGSTATKWREYFFLLSGGAWGALFGGLNDLLVSSAISPEYFLFGKGIAGGNGFALRVTYLGIQAGFGPGAIAAAVFLYINTRSYTSPPLPYSRLSQYFLFPLLGAILVGAFFVLFFSALDPLDFRRQFSAWLDEEGTRNLLRTWWLHLGLYGGYLVGLTLGAIKIAGVCRKA